MAYEPAWGADDHRAQAAKHDRKADGLVSGEAKDSHITAANAHRKAGDLIDKANRASRKTELFESAVRAGQSAQEFVESAKAAGFSVSEIRSLSEPEGRIAELRRKQLQAQGYSETDIVKMLADNKFWND